MSLVAAARAFGAALVLMTAVGARAGDAAGGGVTDRVDAAGPQGEASAPLRQGSDRHAGLGLRDPASAGSTEEPSWPALVTADASRQVRPDTTRKAVGRRTPALRLPLSHRLGLEAGLVDRDGGASPADDAAHTVRHLLGLNLRF